MKRSIPSWSVVCMLAGAAALVVAVALREATCGSSGEAGAIAPATRPARSPASRPATRPAAGLRASVGRWPIYRGGSALLGVAPGRLPGALKRAWRFKTGGAVKSSPVVGGGRLYVGSDDGHLYALDARTGRKIWAFKAGDIIEASPTLARGTVYVGAMNRYFYAIDVRTGKPRWKVKTSERISGAANVVPAPGGKGARVILGNYKGTIYCLDAATGREVWTYDADNYIVCAPAVAGGRVVVGSCDANLHTLTLANGRIDTLVDVGAFVTASAALAGNVAYVGHHGGEFVAVDVAAGKVLWRFKPPKGAPVFDASAAVGTDRVVFADDDGRVYCVRRTDGKELWTFRARDAIKSSPVICGDKVVVGSDDGRLYLLNLADGKRLWSHEIGESISSSPAVAGGMVFVGCDDGWVYAFGPNQDAIR